MGGKKATERLVPDPAGIERAARILRDGGLVAVPTETVYGLAARADRAEAVAAIYAAKERPAFNPLIVHVQDLEQAERFAVFDARARDLATRFWPGPLTLVLPLRANAGLADKVTAGLPTVALRVPAHPAMRALLEATGLPLAAPSANRSQSVSPSTADHVLATLAGRIEAVVDGGPCAQGIESTIVVLREPGCEPGGWNLLRPGPIDRETLEALLGPPAAREDRRVEAPGQLARHYSPGKPLRLDATRAGPNEFMIGFGETPGAINLSPAGDLGEAAARLYACLHAAAQSGRACIAVARIPHRGIGVAINDRLRRAAAEG